MLEVDSYIKPFGKKSFDFAFRHPEDDKLINILWGAVRSSKTWAMIPKTVQLLRYNPGGLKIIFGYSKQTVYNNILNDLFTIIGKENYSYKQMTGELTMFGDKWLVLGAHDEGSEKVIRGTTIGVAIGDELSKVPQSFVMMLLSRLSRRGSRFYATTNPENPFHYIKTDILDNPSYSTLLYDDKWTLDDNPNLDPDFRKNLPLMFKGVFYQRFVLGDWVMAEGAIYGSSYDEGNLFDESTRPNLLYTEAGFISHTVAVDYGSTNPQVYLEILDDGDVLWQIREYYWDSKKQRAQKTDAEYADDLLEFLQHSPIPNAIKSARILVDPSATSFKLECRSRGLYVVDADNEVDEGIRLTSMMLSAKKYRIHKDNCPNTCRELPNYSWDERAAQRGIEQPLKKNDHTCDPIRYKIKTDINPWRIAAVAA